MEYNPVAINEALAYSFTTLVGGGSTQSNRFLIELVNTLTMPEISSPPTPPATAHVTNASVLNLGGFQYTAGDPYSGGSWDIVFTGDDPYSRPDPYRGELPFYGNIYGLTPLNQESFNPVGGARLATSLSILSFPLEEPPRSPDKRFHLHAGQYINDSGQQAERFQSHPPGTLPAAPYTADGPTTFPINYFYTIGNAPTTSASEYNALVPGNYYSAAGATTTPNLNVLTTTPPVYTDPNGSGYSIPPNVPAVIQTFNTASGFDPMINGTPMNPTFMIHPGVLPDMTSSGTVTHRRCPDQFPDENSQPDRGRGCQASPVHLGLPPEARQSVFAGLRDEPDAGRRLDARPLYRRHGHDGRQRSRSKRAIPPFGHLQHDLLGPAASAVSRRTRRAGLAGTANALAATPIAYDTRYGYTEQLVPPHPTIRTSLGPRDFTVLTGDHRPTRRLCRSITRSAGLTKMKWARVARPTTRPKHGITCRFTIAISPAWPSSCSCRDVRPGSLPNSSSSSPPRR